MSLNGRIFLQQKTGILNLLRTSGLSLVQKMGLEPTRYCYHRHLKPARLPIPPLLRTSASELTKAILSVFGSDVKGKK